MSEEPINILRENNSANENEINILNNDSFVIAK